LAQITSIFLVPFRVAALCFFKENPGEFNKNRLEFNENGGMA
jgi:hypothetical protein